MRLCRLIALIACLATAFPLKAEDLYYASRPRDRDGEFHLGILGGVTDISLPILESRGWRVQRSIYGGLLIDWRHWFLGVDAEGYYGTAAARKAPTGSALDNATSSLRQYGGMGNLKMEVPITAGPLRLRPKAGFGYGFLSLTLTLDSPTPDGIGGESRQAVHGGYGTLGLGVDLFEFLTLYGDYAFSVFADAELEGNAFQVPFNLNTAEESFDRLRLGISFRLTRSLLLGAQFVQRRITTGILPSDPFFVSVATPQQQHYSVALIIQL